MVQSLKLSCRQGRQGLELESLQVVRAKLGQRAGVVVFDW